jgi:hypothetical protein
MYSFNQLKYALNIVQDELIEHHFFDIKLSKIDVIWVPYSSAYGFQKYYSTGEIVIPCLSKAKFIELFSSPYVSLKDILRHEYAHAFAFTHKKLLKAKEFKIAFGADHDNTNYIHEFTDELFISEYAATNAMEDFAETFMYYLEYGGKLPKKYKSATIKNKWHFIKQLSAKMKIYNT